MEENVALDSKKQKSFVKSIRGIKKLIKKNEKISAKSKPEKKEEEAKPEKPFSMRLKDDKLKKKKRKNRGLVYLSHIPHGFYEHQMTQYFKQFGVVTNARVIKSKRTGNSKGYAFVEFKEPSVAEIVAETMNNYLMGKRLIKAVYIPPEKQRRKAFRKHWNSMNNPTSIKRLKLKKAFNKDKDESGDLKKAKKLLANLNKTKKRLSGLGINYDFFLPVDIPEALLDKVIKQEKPEEIVKEENESKPKKAKKEKIEPKDDIKDVLKNKQNEEKGKKNIKNEKENKLNKVHKKEKQDKIEVVTNKNKKLVNDKQQKEKEQKLKDAGVISVEEFISLDAEESDDDDDSYVFDSEEYESMLNDDDDVSLVPTEEMSDENDDWKQEFGQAQNEVEDNDSEEEEAEETEDDSEEETEEEIIVTKKNKGKSPKVIQPVQKQTNKQKQSQRQLKNQELKVLNEVKRKEPQKPAVPAKKPKFEKQNQKPLKKQFKKK